MNLERKYSFYRKMAVVLVICFVNQLAFPTVMLALTGGPAQPEFSSFEPVATTNVVNEFTGDLTYNLPVLNIPGADGGGYAMSLSYHSGASLEEEASWVGYGWTFNPGAINRNKRGLPDDWDQVNVTYKNKTPANKTVTVGTNLGLEIYSVDPSLSAGAGLRYNNYKGFGYNANAGIQFGKGVISLGYNVSDGEGSFSLSVNPASLINNVRGKSKDERNKEKANLKAQVGDDKKEARKIYSDDRRSNRSSMLKRAGIGKTLY